MGSMIVAHFLTTLSVRRASDNSAGMWELIGDLVFYSLLLDRLIIVPSGFRTDYASVPRLPVVFLLFGGVADEAAVVHDYLYSNFMQGVTREQADAVLAEACKAMGISAWKWKPMYWAVRAFGASHWGRGSPLATVADASELAEQHD